MALKKAEKENKLEKGKVKEKGEGKVINFLKKSSVFLSVIFFIIWIVIGIAIIVTIGLSIKKGGGLFGQTPVGGQTQAAPEQPTEATLPGIGKVNIACVQESLSQESLQSLVTSGNVAGLSDEEKAKFETCIVEKENPSTEQPDS